MPRGQVKGRYKYNVGENNANARLTWDQVREIRRLYRPKSKDANSAVLAKKFGVSDRAVVNIIRNERWKES